MSKYRDLYYLWIVVRHWLHASPDNETPSQCNPGATPDPEGYRVNTPTGINKSTCNQVS